MIALTVRVFLLLYVISIAGLYMLTGKGSSPILMPGDFYTRKAGRTIYIPFGSSLIVSIILLLIFKAVIPTF